MTRSRSVSLSLSLSLSCRMGTRQRQIVRGLRERRALNSTRASKRVLRGATRFPATRGIKLWSDFLFRVPIRASDRRLDETRRVVPRYDALKPCRCQVYPYPLTSDCWARSMTCKCEDLWSDPYHQLQSHDG